uniref:Uncharacterized protein n=1 Tax=Echinococcus canadensis TaxID=519352 RepID=A0A915EYX2_9CEST
MINIRVPVDLVQVCHINNFAFTTTLLSSLPHGTNPQRFRPLDLKLLSLLNTSLKFGEENQWNTVTIALFLERRRGTKEAKNQMKGQPVLPLGCVSIQLPLFMHLRRKSSNGGGKLYNANAKRSITLRWCSI